MIKIRNSVFETNSSSTHSIIICSQAEYEQLEAGDLFIKRYSDKLITYGDALRELHQYAGAKYDLHDMTREEIIDLFSEYDIAETLDQFYDDEYLDNFSVDYQTMGGEKIVAFGKYGRDG